VVLLLAPGHAVLPRSEGSGGAGCHILSAGVLTPRKGHDRLLRALSRLMDLDWTLTIAGDAQRDPAHAAAVAALVEGLGLSPRVTMLPDVADAALASEWARADLFALASSWEGYPAGAAEAMRRGIPVVGTTVGEMGATVPSTAGILCVPDDGITLSKCLRRAIFDTALRASLAEGAWLAGQAMPGWAEQAAAFVTLIEG
jgi:glycosyltransferase involved in cell wall biosynthesis